MFIMQREMARAFCRMVRDVVKRVKSESLCLGFIRGFLNVMPGKKSQSNISHVFLPGFWWSRTILPSETMSPRVPLRGPYGSLMFCELRRALDGETVIRDFG